jgi:hypothetical protein
MTFDQFAKLGSMVGAIVVGAAAAFTYYDTANRELEKPFNDLQLNLCKEASDAAATLAAFTPRSEKTPPLPSDKLEDPWRAARLRFDQLYWGSLAIVENSAVETSMVKFRKMLRNHEDEIYEKKLNTGVQALMLGAALELAHACRELVSKTWQLRLPDLSGKTGAE